MEKLFALIKNGLIENVIVAEQAFADQMKPKFDHVIRVDELDPLPGIGWSYADGAFTPPAPPEPPVEETPAEPEEPQEPENET